MNGAGYLERPFTELRQRPRVRVPAPFVCSFSPFGWMSGWRGNGDGLGVVFDVSMTGARVLSETAPQRGDRIAVNLRLPKQISPMNVDVATVRWSTDQTFGLEFVTLSPVATMRLRKFMALTLPDRTEALHDVAWKFVHDKEPSPFGRRYLDPSRLDYSVDSLRHVNEYLVRIRIDKDVEKVWNVVVLGAGAYLGEVIRRNDTKHSWRWIDYDGGKSVDPTSFGALGRVIGTAAVLYGGKSDFAFPLAQVEKYLHNGSANDLYCFAQAIIAGDWFDLSV